MFFRLFKQLKELFKDYPKKHFYLLLPFLAIFISLIILSKVELNYLPTQTNPPIKISLSLDLNNNEEYQPLGLIVDKEAIVRRNDSLFSILTLFYNGKIG